MRTALSLAGLCLAARVAAAGSGACEKVIEKGDDVAGVEKHCAFLKKSREKRHQAAYYQLLGQAYLQQHPFRSSPGPALDKALDNLNKSIAIGAALGTATARHYNIRGFAYLQNGTVISKDADKALADFNTAISLDPTVATYYLHRGYAHNQLFNPDAAWADFQKARELDPADPAIVSAYEKQRRVSSPEGQEEVRKEFDAILGRK